MEKLRSFNLGLFGDGASLECGQRSWLHDIVSKPTNFHTAEPKGRDVGMTVDARVPRYCVRTESIP